MSKRRKPHVLNEKKKQYTPFPPAPVPRKVDLQLESGEYFLNEAQRSEKAKKEKIESAKEKSKQKRLDREAEFIPPIEEEGGSKNSSKKKKRERKAVDEEEEEQDNVDIRKEKKEKKKAKKSRKE